MLDCFFVIVGAVHVHSIATYFAASILLIKQLQFDAMMCMIVCDIYTFMHYISYKEHKKGLVFVASTNS